MSAAYDTYNYPRYWNERNYEHLSERIVINKLLKKIKRTKKVIDIGCGYGRLAPVYEDCARNITLADPSKSLLSIAEKKHSKDDKYSYKKTNIYNLNKNFKRNSYDLALCVRVFHHVDDIEKAIKNINFILKKDGYLILEFANKLHGKAIFKNLLKGNFTFPLEIHSLDRRSNKNKRNNSILFLNHHPDIIKKALQENGFEIIEKYSVSNFRYKLLKKIFPLGLLLFLERKSQKFLSKINFGPSIFILAKKG